MRILITGGAGFIGRHTANRLITAGHSVTAIDTLNPQVHQNPHHDRDSFPGPLIQADVADRDTWTSLPPFEAVVHLAAETGVGQSMYTRQRYERVNVIGTENAASFAAQHGITLISLSSRAVYGEGRYECSVHGVKFGSSCCPHAHPRPSRESDERVPVSVYGETKALGEDAAIGAMGTNSPLTIVRPQNVVGPGQALHNPYTGVLAAFLAMVREGKPITVYGDGSDTRDFVHVEDVADLLVWLIEHPPLQLGPRILNVGTGVRTSLSQVAQIAGEAAPVDSFTVEYVDVHRPGDIRHACADLSRLKSEGAPLPHKTSADAISDFIHESWAKPGAAATIWDDALAELRAHGLTS